MRNAAPGTRPVIRSQLETCNADQDYMEQRRHLVRTLMGGTWSMRLAGETYLPKEPKEGNNAYLRRLKRTTLKNYFKKTLRALVGRVFVKDMITNVSNDDFKKMLENVDLQGRTLNVFAKDVLTKGMQDGMSFIMADMPKRPVDPETGLPISVSLRDMRDGKFRPYLVHVTADRIIDWRASSGISEPVLKQVRFWENQKVEDGEFSTKEVERIRVLDMVYTLVEEGRADWRCRHRVFERVASPTLIPPTSTPSTDPAYGWIMVDEHVTTATEIPFFPFYAERENFMVGFPPLEDLAYLNLTHWQSYSDQRNILHVARVPILFGKGFDKDEDDKYEVDLEVGANIAMFGPENSDLKYVEHQGYAIRSGKEDLDSLEEEMLTFGLEFMMSRPSHESATARTADQMEVNSPLKSVVDNLIDTLENALVAMAGFGGFDNEDPEVRTQGELGLSLKDSATVANLIEARKNGMISLVTFITELKRMSVLSDDVDPKKEAAAVEQENQKKQEDALALIAAKPAPAPPGGGGNNGNNEDPNGGRNAPPDRNAA